MNKGMQIAIIVLALGGAAYLIIHNLTKEKPGSAEGAHAHYYICSNPDCKEEYSWTPGEDLGGREDASICPKCGTPNAMDAAKCPSCGRYHALEGHGRYKKNCPYCGAPMPPLVEQVRH